MLSILIPVFNFNVCELVKKLQHQALGAACEFEILVLDDGSEDSFKLANRKLSYLEGVVYKEETTNLGRSKIRNKLAGMAKFENLLFMDCDSGILTFDYLEKYLKYASNADVIYGGRLYLDDQKHNSTCKLHWLYGIKREQVPAKSRKIEPNRSFQTNNFLIKKNLIQSIGFNESIKGYGHEDTLFGYELRKRNITIFHIENPVIHLGLEQNEEFLRKTREGIKNLKRIMRINGNEKRLVSDIKILAYYKKIEKLKLARPIEYLYKRYEHVLRKNLMGQNPNLIIFDIYKLGYLCSISGEA